MLNLFLPLPAPIRGVVAHGIIRPLNNPDIEYLLCWNGGSRHVAVADLFAATQPFLPPRHVAARHDASPVSIPHPAPRNPDATHTRIHHTFADIGTIVDPYGDVTSEVELPWEGPPTAIGMSL